MFQENRIVFLYCISPVHMGAGTAVGGLIDNPIQREKHTDYPVMAGSGIKGAIRHDYWAQDGSDKLLLKRIFGPEQDAAEHAGAVSFGDGQLLAFPVRCAKAGYVYATSPYLLARLQRQMRLSGIDADWNIPEISSGGCRLRNPDLLSDDQIALEAYELSAQLDADNGLGLIADWLAENCLPAGEDYNFFRDKLRKDLVLLSNEEMHYFAVNSTAVEPHVRIDDVSGTADGGALFYSENLPAESLLYTTLMASRERYKKGDNSENRMEAKQIADTLANGNDRWRGLHGRMVQFGGDATTGRGQIVCSFIGGEHD